MKRKKQNYPIQQRESEFARKKAYGFTAKSMKTKQNNNNKKNKEFLGQHIHHLWHL